MVLARNWRDEWERDARLSPQATHEIERFVQELLATYEQDLQLMHLRGQIDRHEAIG